MGKVLHSVFLILVLSLPIAGCSTQDVDKGTTRATITGRVYKGLVQSTTVTAYELLADRTKGRILATDTTDSPEDIQSEAYLPGTFHLEISGFHGAVLVEAGGTTSAFLDEASQESVHFAPDDVLTAVLPDVQEGSRIEATISPLTEFAARLAFCLENRERPLLQAHADALQKVQQVFGVRDILALEPSAFTSEKQTSRRADVYYAYALAALSQDAFERAGPGKVMALVKQLAADFSDCNPDGKLNGKGLTVGATELGAEYYSHDLPNAVLSFTAAQGLDSADAIAYASRLTNQKTRISGWMSLGPVANAAVVVSALHADGTLGAQLGMTATDAGGAFSVEILPYGGAVVISTGGGTYREEADGRSITLSQGAALHTIVPAVGMAQEISAVQLSPLTEWAYRSFACAAGSTVADRWNTATTFVENTFGIPDFARTQPADLTRATSNGNSAALRHGLLNAALSQWASTMPMSAGKKFYTAYDLVEIIGKDFSDCKLDGAQAGSPLSMGTLSLRESSLREGLATAAADFLAGPRNQSGLAYHEFAQAIVALGGSASGTVYGRVYKGIASGYDIVASDWHGWVNGGELATAKAAGDTFELTLQGFYGPAKLTAEGASATYRDEEQETSVPFGANKLRAYVRNFRNGERLSYIISPLSDFAFTLAACYVQKGLVAETHAFQQANTVIGAHFGVADFYATAPKDVASGSYAGAVSDADRFAMALAGLSRLAQDINKISGLDPAAYISSIDLAAKLSSDLAQDCTWDGVGPGNLPITVGDYKFSADTPRLELAEAISAFMRSPKNRSGISVAEANAYARFLSENDSSLFSETHSLAFDDAAPELSFTPAPRTWVHGEVGVQIAAADATAVVQLAVTGPATLAALPDHNPQTAGLAITIPTNSFTDGPFSLWVQAEDARGNRSVTEYQLQIDNRFPLVTAGGFITNRPEAKLTGTWTALSGITSATLTHRTQLQAFPVHLFADGSFEASVSLAEEGRNEFELALVSGAGKRAQYTLAVTRDTEGPQIQLRAGVHTGPDSAQPYDEAAFQAGTVEFETVYPTAGNPFEYVATRFEFDVTDAIGQVISVSKKLLRNGALVTAPDPQLPFLGDSTFGNEIFGSMEHPPQDTRWDIVVTAADQAGNISIKKYPFQLRVQAPAFAVVSNIDAGSCAVASPRGRYLVSYASTCGNHTNWDEVRGNASNANKIGGRVSMQTLELENPADIPLYLDPSAYAATTYQKVPFRYRERYHNYVDYAQGLSTPLYTSCAADVRLNLDSTFTCVNYAAGSRKSGDLYSPSSSSYYAVSPVLTVTDLANTVLSPATVVDGRSLWKVEPGARVKVWLQLPNLSSLRDKSYYCAASGQSGQDGTLVYLWWDDVGASWRQYTTCHTADIVWFVYLPAATYKFGVSPGFAPAVMAPRETNIPLPAWNVSWAY